MAKIKTMRTKAQRSLAGSITEMGALFRYHVDMADPKDRDVARATICGALVGAAIHDADDPDKVLAFLGSFFELAPVINPNASGDLPGDYDPSGTA